LRFKRLNQSIALRTWRFAGDQRRFARRQQAGISGVLYGGGKIITPLRLSANSTIWLMICGVMRCCFFSSG
jgi:hypothetical protein